MSAPPEAFGGTTLHSSREAAGAPSRSPLTAAQIGQLAHNYKLTPATLMHEVAPWWIPAPFLQYLSAEIASAVARGNCGLLISAPPRHGKSKLVTVATPLWVLENFPNKNVIVSTYGEDLSTDFTREVKDLIKANRQKLSIEIRRDVDRAQNFITPQGGGLKAVGLRGTITGRGADVLIIDDYIKEPKEALNPAYLESLVTWYTTVARTRLEPGAVVIVVATRWVPNDLHGHIERLELTRRRPFYRVIKVSAISGMKDKETGEWVPNPKIPEILGRAPGEPLFPQRYDRESLLDIIDELGYRWFQAMFQQDPAADGVAVTDINNLRFITRQAFNELKEQNKDRPGRFKRARSWDFASTKDAGDFTAGPIGTYDTIDDKMYVEDIVHMQASAGHVERTYKLLAGSVDENTKEDIPGLDPLDVEYVIEQEPGSAGKFATLHWKGLAPKRQTHVVLAASSGSKLLKAQPLLAATENFKVVLVVDDLNDIRANPWVQKFITEFAVFDGSGVGHDDQMDALASLWNHFTGHKPRSGVFGRSAKAKEAIEQQRMNGNVERTDRRSGGSTFGRRGTSDDSIRRQLPSSLTPSGTTPHSSKPPPFMIIGGNRNR